jgi:tetratricopeptide (TPR) repeat protein
VTERNRLRERRRLALALASLAALTLAVFWPVLHAGFVVFDDGDYVTGNPWVRGGLSWPALRWAFTSVGYAANWHPLAWGSHLVDVSLFGLRPGGHHATSLLVHLAAATSLLLVLRAATGALWRSALVAALFAVHPLHVESVAWVSERKDVLSALLFFLTLGAYLRYARRPGAARYGAVLVAFALALLAKSMVVTLPVVLLAFDWWPLGRLRAAGRDWGRLALEKVPLAALAAGAGTLTYLAQSRAGSLAPAGVLPPGARAMNAADAAVLYLRDTVLPSGLAVLYPYPTHGWSALPAWRVAVAVALLTGATALALLLRRRAPALAFGWGWYLVVLAPVSGLLHVGVQARADRYTYLPLVGVFLAAAMAPPRRTALAWGPAACAAVLSLAVVARIQAGTWRDSITLFRHAAAVTSNNWQASANLGKALAEAGRKEEAVAAYREALRLLPYLGEERLALGGLLLGLGRPAEAVGELQAGVRTRPDLWWGHLNLADALLALGRQGEAEEEYRRTLALRPRSAPAHNNLGTILFNRGRIEEARLQFAEAARIDPRFAEAHYNLGVTASRLGRPEEASARWEEALRLDPGHAGARRSLAELRGR